MKNKRISFKTKVLVPIIAISVISVLIVSAINYSRLDAVVKIKTNANLEIFADSILAQIDHLNIILDAVKQTLNEKHTATAKTAAFILDNAGREITSQELQRLAELLDIIEFNIADRDGIIINSNIQSLIGDDFKTTETTLPYMALADGTLAQLSEEPRPSILPDFSLGEINHFTGAARLGGGFIQLGFNAGVVGRLQEQINIESAVKNTGIGDGGFGFVLSGGIIIAHPNEDLLGDDVSGNEWYRTTSASLQDGEGGGFEWIKIDGERYYAGFKSKNDITVIGLLPHKEYYRELYRILIGTAVFLFIAIIVMVLTVYFVLGRLLFPVKYLVEGLEKIAETKMNARIEGSYNDEYDKIKDAINSMASEIKNYMNVISGIEYAGKIQKNLLPPQSVFKEAFADYSCLWKPKDIVSGDIYWIKNFEGGTVLCVCDCTGHGTPGAFLTMLVMSIFETVVSPGACKDAAEKLPAAVIWELEKHLIAALNVQSGSIVRSNSSVSSSEALQPARGITINDGCDLAVLYIAKDGSAAISSANTNVFICDGEKVTRIKGQKIRVGDGVLRGAQDIRVFAVPAKEGGKFYIASDGLYEQVGGSENLPFGYDIMEKIILENHEESQSVISEKILLAFEKHRGKNAQRDDFQLISFRPK